MVVSAQCQNEEAVTRLAGIKFFSTKSVLNLNFRPLFCWCLDTFPLKRKRDVFKI